MSIRKPSSRLLEFLLTTNDLQASARRAVDWIVGHAGVKQAVVAVVEPGTSQLLLVAEHGVTSSAIVDFSLTTNDDAHPLIGAMQRLDVTYFDELSDQISSADRGGRVSCDPSPCGRRFDLVAAYC